MLAVRPARAVGHRLKLSGLMIVGSLWLCATVPVRAEGPTISVEVSPQAVPRSFKEKMLDERSKASVSDWRTDSETNVSTQGFKMLQGLALCIGAFLIGFGIFKKVSGRTAQISGRTMKVLDRIPLAAKTMLVLAEVEGRKYLITVGSDRSTVVKLEQSEHRPAEFDESIELLCKDELKLSQVG